VISAIRRLTQEEVAAAAAQSSRRKRPANARRSTGGARARPCHKAVCGGSPEGAAGIRHRRRRRCVDSPVSSPGDLPGEFGSSEFQAAEQKLGKLLRALVQSSSSDLHLRVGEPRCSAPMARSNASPARRLSVNDLELLVLSIMPEPQPRRMEGNGRHRFRL